MYRTWMYAWCAGFALTVTRHAVHPGGASEAFRPAAADQPGTAVQRAGVSLHERLLLCGCCGLWVPVYAGTCDLVLSYTQLLPVPSHGCSILPTPRNAHRQGLRYKRLARGHDQNEQRSLPFWPHAGGPAAASCLPYMYVGFATHTVRPDPNCPPVAWQPVPPHPRARSQPLFLIKPVSHRLFPQRVMSDCRTHCPDTWSPCITDSASHQKLTNSLDTLHGSLVQQLAFGSSRSQLKQSPVAPCSRRNATQRNTTL